jgi:hypothetical protein
MSTKKRGKTSDIIYIVIMITVLVIFIGVFLYGMFGVSVGKETIFIAKIVKVQQLYGYTIFSLGNGTDITLSSCNLPSWFVLNANYQITIFTNQFGDMSLVSIYRIEGEL